MNPSSPLPKLLDFMLKVSRESMGPRKLSLELCKNIHFTKKWI